MALTFRELIVKLVDFLLPSDRKEEEISHISLEAFIKRAKTSTPIDIPWAHSVFSYKDPIVKSAVWLLKYRQNEKAADLLSGAMANTLEEKLLDLMAFENFSNPLLVPVPMSPKRQKERGGNHTEILCQKIMLFLPLQMAEYEPRALFKILETENQVRMKNRASRLKNLENSFSAKSNLVRGKNIVLIDDVITTGATITECQRTLLKAGAKKVLALSAAH